MKVNPRAKIATFFASVALLAGVTACSNDAADTATDATANSEAEITIVTSTKIWPDVADAVTDDDKVSIEPIIASNDTDPHSYQPSAADMAKVENADILLVGGGHYDAWLTSALDENTDKVIISGMQVAYTDHDHEGHDHEGHDHTAEDKAAGDHDHDGHDHEGRDHEGHDHGELNEHIWYDTFIVDAVAHDLADALAEMGAQADTERIHTQIDEIKELKDKLPAAKVAQVHPLADDILKDTKISDITPKGYREATLGETEPAAADVKAMLDLIDSGELDFLIDAPQTRDQVSERLVEAATAKGVTIVNVYESPSESEDFFELYQRTLTEMEMAS